MRSAGTGHCLSGESIRQIVYLLSTTEMALSEIAERMSCSKSTISSVNRRFQVRLYNGLRSSWLKADLETKVEWPSPQSVAKKKCRMD
jgi:hypothetical protein